MGTWFNLRLKFGFLLLVDKNIYRHWHDFFDFFSDFFQIFFRFFFLFSLPRAVASALIIFQKNTNFNCEYFYKGVSLNALLLTVNQFEKYLFYQKSN